MEAGIYKKMATRWLTNKFPWSTYYGDFEVTENHYGGVSMFVPNYILQHTNNDYIKQMGWYYAAGYSDIGW